MVTPEEILEKHKAKLKKKGFKPKAAKKGLETMFAPRYETNKGSTVEPSLESIKLEKVEPVTKVSTKPLSRKDSLPSEKVSSRQSQKNILSASRDGSAPDLKVEGTDLSFSNLLRIIALFKKLYVHDLKLFETILIKSEMGKIKRIAIEESDYKDFGLHKGAGLKTSRENLLDLGLVECEVGYKSAESKRESFFYTIPSIVLTAIN